MQSQANPSAVRVTVKRSGSEWIARFFQDGIFQEARSYYSDSKEDAEATAEAMREEARAQGFRVE